MSSSMRRHEPCPLSRQDANSRHCNQCFQHCLHRYNLSRMRRRLQSQKMRREENLKFYPPPWVVLQIISCRVFFIDGCFLDCVYYSKSRSSMWQPLAKHQKVELGLRATLYQIPDRYMQLVLASFFNYFLYAKTPIACGFQTASGGAAAVRRWRECPSERVRRGILV